MFVVLTVTVVADASGYETRMSKSEALSTFVDFDSRYLVIEIFGVRWVVIAVIIVSTRDSINQDKSSKKCSTQESYKATTS